MLHVAPKPRIVIDGSCAVVWRSAGSAPVPQTSALGHMYYLDQTNGVIRWGRSLATAGGTAHFADMAEPASATDTVISLAAFQSAISESASGSSVQAALMAGQAVISEPASGTSTQAALASLQATITQNAAGTDASAAMMAGQAAITETASGSAVVAELTGNNYPDNFQSYTPGAGLPTGWTSRWDAGTWSVVDDAGEILVRDIGSYARVFASCNAVDGDAARADAEVLVRFRSDAVNNDKTQMGCVIRGSGSGASETGYESHVYTATAGPNILITKFVAGVYSGIGLTVPKAMAPNSWYWLRFRANGTSLKARLWADGSPEPAGWDIERTDTDITAAGWCGPFVSSFSVLGKTADFADFAVATGGATATMGTTAHSSAITEAASGTDLTTAAAAFLSAVSESASGTANQSASAAFAAVITEAASGTAAVDYLGALSASMIELASATDATVAIMAALAAIVESGTATATTAGNSSSVSAMAESGSASDTVTRAFATFGAISESATATDTTDAAIGALTAAMVEAALAGDTVAATAAMNAAITELGNATSVQDWIGRVIVLCLAMSNTVSKPVTLITEVTQCRDG